MFVPFHMVVKVVQSLCSWQTTSEAESEHIYVFGSAPDVGRP